MSYKVLHTEIDKMSEADFSAAHVGAVVGSSKIGIICGLLPMKGAVEQWMEDTGKVEPMKANFRMKLGKKLEPVLRELCAEKFKEDGHEIEIQVVNEMWGNDQYPNCVASLDNIAHFPNFVKKPIEAKSTSIRAAQHWSDTEAPDLARTQLNWQMGIGGVFDSGYVAGLIGNESFFMPEFQFDYGWFMTCMEIAQRYLASVQTDTPPIPVAPSDLNIIKKMYALKEDQIVTLEETQADQYMERSKEYDDLNAKLKQIGNELDTLEAMIRQEMRGAAFGNAGRYKIYIKEHTRNNKAKEASVSTYTSFKIKGE